MRNDGTLHFLACDAILLSVLLLHSTFLFSQTADSSSIGNVRTVVVDSTGAVIPNAEVTFKGEETITAKTAQDGSIRLQLPYGEYSVTIAMLGFTPATVQQFSIQSAYHPDLRVVLQVAPTDGDPDLLVGVEPQTSVLTNVIEPVRVQESSQKQACQPPKPKFTPDPLPPASWEGKGPKTALTILKVTVDKKGKVHNPVVVRSGGKDVDKQAADAVSGWRFAPAKCGSEPLETQINIEVSISLR